MALLIVVVRPRDVEHPAADPLRIHRGQHRHVDQSTRGQQEGPRILGKEHGGIQEVYQRKKSNRCWSSSGLAIAIIGSDLTTSTTTGISGRMLGAMMDDSDISKYSPIPTLRWAEINFLKMKYLFPQSRSIKQIAYCDEWKAQQRHHSDVLRLCHTCRVVRPLRAKHCRICDRCVAQECMILRGAGWPQGHYRVHHQFISHSVIGWFDQLFERTVQCTVRIVCLAQNREREFSLYV